MLGLDDQGPGGPCKPANSPERHQFLPLSHQGRPHASRPWHRNLLRLHHEHPVGMLEPFARGRRGQDKVSGAKQTNPKILRPIRRRIRKISRTVRPPFRPGGTWSWGLARGAWDGLWTGWEIFIVLDRQGRSWPCGPHCLLLGTGRFPSILSPGASPGLGGHGWSTTRGIVP